MEEPQEEPLFSGLLDKRHRQLLGFLEKYADLAVAIDASLWVASALTSGVKRFKFDGSNQHMSETGSWRPTWNLHQRCGASLNADVGL